MVDDLAILNEIQLISPTEINSIYDNIIEIKIISSHTEIILLNGKKTEIELISQRVRNLSGPTFLKLLFHFMDNGVTTSTLACNQLGITQEYFRRTTENLLKIGIIRQLGKTRQIGRDGPKPMLFALTSLPKRDLDDATEKAVIKHTQLIQPGYFKIIEAVQVFEDTNLPRDPKKTDVYSYFKDVNPITRDLIKHLDVKTASHQIYNNLRQRGWKVYF